MKARGWILGAAVALIALGAPVSSAFGAGFTLHLSAPGPAVVGKPMVLQATGTIPTDQLQYPVWFSLYALSPSVTPSCPVDHFEAAQLANSTGGARVTSSQREIPDASGNFRIPVGVTPSAPGSVLLCGYTDDGMATTLAIAPMLLNIQAPTPASGGGGSRPVSFPEQARRGVRSCRALLSGSGLKSCIRRTVKQANAGCRRLHSKRSRTKCLRGVKRAARG
jgi:hypothetical protein